MNLSMLELKTSWVNFIPTVVKFMLDLTSSTSYHILKLFKMKLWTIFLTNRKKVMTDEIAKKIKRVLETQNFKDWHDNEFNDFVTGWATQKSEERILDDIKTLFKDILK